ncbi:hypothetical protein I3842_02G058300 [Carya illinoinensis]|uniref:Uncharacterized protein n=1 Tax=Carya illinoinensis TaxID=32201 RepID=A0A922FSR4_CARIL|nr:hypothetical protein I3842_02G058300 [Carya illinoinensis]
MAHCRLHPWAMPTYTVLDSAIATPWKLASHCMLQHYRSQHPSWSVTTILNHKEVPCKAQARGQFRVAQPLRPYFGIVLIMRMVELRIKNRNL